MAAFLRKLPHLPVELIRIGAAAQPWAAGRISGRIRIKGIVLSLLCPGLALADDIDLTGLVPAQRYLVTYDFIFYRIPQGGVEHHPDLLALDESHLGDPLAEGAVSVNLYYDASFSGL